MLGLPDSSARFMFWKNRHKKAPIWSKQDEEANFIRPEFERVHYAAKRKRQGVEEGEGVKNIEDVIRTKRAQMEDLARQIKVLKEAAALLEDDAKPEPVPVPVPGPIPASSDADLVTLAASAQTQAQAPTRVPAAKRWP